MIVTSKKNTKILVSTIFVFFVLSYNYAILSVSALSNDNSERVVDIFGINGIYPNRPGGREWFLNSDDPRSDGIFFMTSDKNITRQSDGSWLINSSEVRMNVDTPPGTPEWK
jgi:hypothetical protein